MRGEAVEEVDEEHGVPVNREVGFLQGGSPGGRQHPNSLRGPGRRSRISMRWIAVTATESTEAEAAFMGITSTTRKGSILPHCNLNYHHPRSATGGRHIHNNI